MNEKNVPTAHTDNLSVERILNKPKTAENWNQMLISDLFFFHFVHENGGVFVLTVPRLAGWPWLVVVGRGELVDTKRNAPDFR